MSRPGRLVLALDSATEACSAAIARGSEVLASRHEMIGRGHAQRLLPMVQQVLGAVGIALEDLGGIALGRGPGSFTGVRVAFSVGQGLAFGAGLPLLPVSGLQALALRAHRQHGCRHVMACLDARMREVYVAGFACTTDLEPVLAGSEAVMAPGAVAGRLAAEPGKWYLAGPGAAAYPELRDAQDLASGTDAGLWPDAGEIALLGLRMLQRNEGVEPESARPVYLRNEVAHRGGGPA